MAEGENQDSSPQEAVPTVDFKAVEKKNSIIRSTFHNVSHGVRIIIPSFNRDRDDQSAQTALQVDEASKSEVFRYKPLNAARQELRLVELLPGNIEDRQIRCKIINSNATGGTGASRRRYRAVSYMWGSSDTGRSIELDGKFYLVRENLWQGLYHIRSPTRSIHLWVDAISINQEDPTERGHQVSLMGLIYSEAVEVIVWLGIEKDDSTLALKTISRGARIYRDASNPSRADATPMKNTVTQRKVAALVALTKREYWTRIWIIQEIIKAKSVLLQCGFMHIGWYDFAIFCLSLDHPSSGFGVVKPSLAFEINQNRQMHEGHRSLLNLLEGTIYSRASDPKDRIYALLGLVSKDDWFLNAVLNNNLPDFGRWPFGTRQEQWLIDYNKTPTQLYVNLLTYAPWFQPSLQVNYNRTEFFKRGRRLSVYFSQLLLRFLGETEAPSGENSYVESPRPLLSQSYGPLTPKIPPIRVQATGYYKYIRALSPIFDSDTPHEKILNWCESKLSDQEVCWLSTDEKPFNRSQASEALANLDDEDLERLHPTLFRSHRPIVQFTGDNYEKYIECEREACHFEAEDPSQYHPIAFPERRTFRVFFTEHRQLGFITSSAENSDKVFRFHGCDVSMVTRPWSRRPSSCVDICGRAMFVTAKDSTSMEAADAQRFKYDVFEIEEKDTSRTWSPRDEERVAFDLSRKKTFALLPSQWKYLTW